MLAHTSTVIILTAMEAPTSATIRYGAGNASKAIECVVRAGEGVMECASVHAYSRVSLADFPSTGLYVPAGWWHEVKSSGDKEGKVA